MEIKSWDNREWKTPSRESFQFVFLLANWNPVNAPIEHKLRKNKGRSNKHCFRSETNCCSNRSEIFPKWVFQFWLRINTWGHDRSILKLVLNSQYWYTKSTSSMWTLSLFPDRFHQIVNRSNYKPPNARNVYKYLRLLPRITSINHNYSTSECWWNNNKLTI